MTIADRENLFSMPRPNQWLAVKMRGVDVTTVYVGNVGFDASTVAAETVATVLRLLGQALYEMATWDTTIPLERIEHIERDAGNVPVTSYTWLR